MRITKKMAFDEYWNAQGFQMKKPDCRGSERHRVGDNIYCPVGNGKFVQQESMHSAQDKRRDLSGGYVLASDDFVYFGAEAIDLPGRFSGLVAGRGHRKLTPGASADDERLVADFDEFFTGLPRGRCGFPRKWLGGNEGGTSSQKKSVCKG